MALREVYDGEGNLIDVEECADPPPRHFTPIEILGLFTLTEQAAIDQSTSIYVIASKVQMFGATNAIPLTDARFVAAVNLFEGQGIITSQRKAQILAGEAPT